MASFLISKGAGVNNKTKVSIVSIVITDLLTSQGFSPQNGYTPLHAACLKGHTAVVKVLIGSQAKLDIKTNVSVDLLVVCMGMDS